MAAVNSLLFLLATTTLAPVEQPPPGDYAGVTTYEPDWMKDSLSTVGPDEITTAPPEPDDHQKCPKGEEEALFSHCMPNCTNYNRPIVCPVYPNPGCVCKLPTIRGPEGKCITWDECPIFKRRSDLVLRQEPDYLNCRPDEEESCFSHCQPNCTNYNQDINCPIYCVRGCVCKSPLIRGPGDSCVMPEQCPPPQSTGPLAQILPPYIPPAASLPPICGPGEEFSYCGALCQKNCDNYDKEESCLKLCVPGCVCREPLIRAADRSCVMPEQCRPQTPSSSTPSDYEPFYNTEEPKDDQVTTEMSNDLDGILRQYPPVCKEHEILSWCGLLPQCQHDCYNYGRNLTWEEDRCLYMCGFAAGCVCREPYIRGPDKSCILYEECPNYTTPPTASEGTTAALKNAPQSEDETVTCPENEEYIQCGSLCEKDCANLGVDEPCEPGCETGCVCKEGWVRGFNHRCVRAEECAATRSTTKQPAPVISRQGWLPDLPKLKCRDENEEFSLCASVCPNNCANYQTDRLCNKICVPGCRCKTGYVLGKDGTCMKQEYCKEQKPEDCSENEYFDECGSHCETDCFNPILPNLSCENKQCKRGCFCKPGLVRSADWTCVPPTSCPARSAMQTFHSLRYVEKNQSV